MGRLIFGISRRKFGRAEATKGSMTQQHRGLRRVIAAVDTFTHSGKGDTPSSPE